jgi:UDPglucose--hexose-1-phosphate uridylyltransferase
VIAPGRARRPGAGSARIEDATQEELDACPFCAGREDRTPPETLTIGAPWQVRVVPNLYPAFERQEVVVHTPRHVRTFGDLTDDELAVVAEAWQRRARDTRPAYLHALVNEGRAAGASLPHSHSQLVWLGEDPVEVRIENDFELPSLLDDRVLIAERDGVAACVHPFARAPYELLIAARSREGNAFESVRLAVALGLLAEIIRRLRAVEGPVPWNAWLHDDDHWHIHVLPRLTVFAGIELGAGIYVNTLPPEDAAAALREARPSGP